MRNSKKCKFLIFISYTERCYLSRISARFSVRLPGRSSVRTSVHNLHRPWLSVHLNDLFAETTASRISNFTCSMIRLQGFGPVKVSLVENPRWPPILKIAKPLKSTFLQNGLVFLAEIYMYYLWDVSAQ